MKIAIPVAKETMCRHFGHCEQFYIYEIEADTKSIKNISKLTPPPHAPGVLPRWLKEKEVNIIIAGGMGEGAQNLFSENDIEVFVGAPVIVPEELVEKYLQGTLISGNNACDH